MNLVDYKRNLERRLENNTNELNSVLKGLEIASNIITSTMGGTGKNVLMYQDDELTFTKDGVSVAKKIKLQNREQDAGAQLLINASTSTVRQCGDGTTLTSLLTYQFVKNLFEQIKDKPVNDILDYTRDAVKRVIDEIREQSTKIESYDDIYKIALTSSKSHTIAEMIQGIYKKTGFNASIAVELSEHFTKTYTEVTEGLVLDSGLINPGFANMDNGNCSFEEPHILIYDSAIVDAFEMSKVVEEYKREKIPLVLIAPSFSDNFISWCLSNKQSVGLQICLVETPGWGASVLENKRDIRAFLNGDMANKVVITPFDMTIYNNPDKKKIRNRVKQLNAKLEVETEDFSIDDYQKRIANLQRSSAIIYVGGITRKNATEEFDRIEDAVGACRSALVEGYVEGQGVALMKIKGEYNEWFKKIIESPYYTILNNASLMAPSQLKPYNVRTRDYDENLVDPSLVIIKALENSFALAELLINTSYILYDKTKSTGE